MSSKERRDADGKGYRWTMSSPSMGCYETSVRGYTIDNLNSKSLPDASGHFEKIFIHVREILLEYNGTLEDNRYDVCHQISRYLSQNFNKL